MKKRLLTAALVLCLLLALMPAAAAYTPEDCVNYYGGHDWQQGAVVVQPSGVLAGQREWTCRRCGRNGYTYIDPPIRAYEQFYDVDPNRWSYDGISYCVKTGAMSGTGTHTFAPYGVTTRAQIVQILYELSGAPAVSGGTPVSRSDAELVPQGGRLGLSERRRVRHERHDLLARGARDARTDRLHHDELFLQRFEAEAAVGAG